MYRAVLRLPGGDAPFGLEVAQEQQQYVLYLINGAERTRVSNVQSGGRRAARGVSRLREFAARDDASQQPRRQRHAHQGRRQGTGDPVHGDARRNVSLLPRSRPTDNADVGGTWDATFTNEKGETSQGDPVARTTARPRNRQRHDAHRRSPLPRRSDARRRAAAFDFRRRAGVSVQAEGRRERRAGGRLLAGPRVTRKGCRATQRCSDTRRRRQADHPARQQASASTSRSPTSTASRSR